MGPQSWIRLRYGRSTRLRTGTLEIMFYLLPFAFFMGSVPRLFILQQILTPLITGNCLIHIAGLEEAA
jgi:hypothetical protein